MYDLQHTAPTNLALENFLSVIYWLYKLHNYSLFISHFLQNVY